VLATSREPLGLAAEYAFRLSPLPLPGPGQDPAHVPSVEVFLDRAARIRPGTLRTPADMRTVADIVRRLDGMPLAIELAAGRLSTFSVADLRARLGRALDLLGDGRPSGDQRHRTLRATIDWSYQLLAEEEQRVFRHLSIFADGVDLDTAEQIAAELSVRTDPGSVLARLVDASMIEADFSGGTRYRMLHLLRAFGLDRLAAASEEQAAAGRMVRWAVELAGWFAASVATDREPSADAVLRRELPNLRVAWRLARGSGDLDAAAAMVTGLFDAIAYRDLIEFREWAEELAQDTAMATHPRSAAVLGAAAEAVYHRGDYLRADRLARAGLARARSAAETDETAAGFCLLPLTAAAFSRGAYADAVKHGLAAAALGHRRQESIDLAALANAYAGDLDRARELNQQDLDAVARPTFRAWRTYVTGEIDHLSGRNERAEQHYLEAIELARSSGATFVIGVATVGLVTVRAAAGRTREALAGYCEAIDYFSRTGNWTHQWITLRGLARLLRRLGDPEPAALLDAAADQAPDAPMDHTYTREPPHPAPAAPIPGRSAILELARQAIQRNLRSR
jgi:predicted ATPase